VASLVTILRCDRSCGVAFKWRSASLTGCAEGAAFVALLSHAHAPLFSNEQAVARVLYSFVQGRDEILVHRTIGAAVPPVIGVLSAGALEVVDALRDACGGCGGRLVQRQGQVREAAKRRPT
jgi:hypothetical protein